MLSATLAGGRDRGTAGAAVVTVAVVSSGEPRPS